MVFTSVALHYHSFLLFLIGTTLLACSGGLPEDGQSSAWRLQRETALYSQPSLTAPVARLVLAKQRVYPTGRVSATTSPLLRGSQLLELPWIEVFVQDSVDRAWLLADATVLFRPRDSVAARQWLHDQQLRCLWQQEYPTYQEYLRQVGEFSATDTAWLVHFQRGQHLRHWLRQRLRRDARLYALLSSLNPTTLLPGYTVLPSDKRPDWWLDYTYWQTTAAQTPDSLDDRLLDLHQRAWGRQALEDRYPTWVLPVTDTAVYSLLGRGIHYTLLERVARMTQQHRQLHPVLQPLTEQILADIHQLDNQYWEAAPLLVQELDSLLHTDWSVLNRASRVALRTRRQQFLLADSLGLITNVRSGRYEAVE